MAEKINRIQSFSINHDTLTEGIYISRTDKGVVTYDLRTRKPNRGDYMNNITMHSLEHMFATYIRNSDISESIIYFGPMGCQTGFYLLVTDDIAPNKVYETILDVLKKTVLHNGGVFGASAAECGNYRTLNIEAAKAEASRYLSILEANSNPTFIYPQ